MGKFLLVAVVVALVVAWLVRRPRRRDDAAGPARPDATPPPSPMVRCAHCQVHLPGGDALGDGQRFYCTEEHRRLGPR